jgi:hypothetical protein
MGDEVTGSYRVETRKSSNGIVHGNDTISPKAVMIANYIMKNRGIHLVYSQFLDSGNQFVVKELITRGFKEFSPEDLREDIEEE